MKKILTISAALALIFIAFMVWYVSGEKSAAKINSFDECAAAGYPIQESYPERCSVPGGQSFTKQY